MLVLARKLGEEIVIGTGADQIVVTIASITRDKVRVGVTAPRAVPVHRREVADRLAPSGYHYVAPILPTGELP